MKIINKEEFLANKEFYLEEIKKGKIFIYPTDTIYGIGCDALNNEAVLRIRNIKNREEKPFSVIAPNKEWIKENCIINQHAENWIAKLPGQLTLILELRNDKAISKQVSVKTLGVRILDHWFSKIIEQSRKPFVTTSANPSGQKFMTDLNDLDKKIRESVDFIIYTGALENNPSTVVNLLNNKEEIRHR